MSNPASRDALPPRLRFYLTPEHECSYLPGRRAVTVFADPAHPKTPAMQSALSVYGFRRSGEHLYVPRCPTCSACVPVRVPVREFRPRRRHRRTRHMNRDLAVRDLPAVFDERHFRIYERYQHARHRGGSMDRPTREQYLEFLTSSWSDTRFFEFALHGEPLAVSVVDLLSDGLSAVYTFFEPAQAARAPGVNALLHAIEETTRRGLDWLYLGYWVSGCRKMEYKQEYLPQERLMGGRWRRIEP